MKLRGLERPSFEDESASNSTASPTDQEDQPSNLPAENKESQPCDSINDKNVSDSNFQQGGWRWTLICIAIYMAATIYGLDTTIAADVQAAVIETFDDVSQVLWLGAGFVLGSTASILPYGALYNVFDMKWLYISGIVLFVAGSALCGGAPSMNALIVGRVLAGVGGTGMYLGNLNYMTALTPARLRGVYVTGVGYFWGVGCILGPIMGGSFSDSSATWRWAFYINLVIAAATAPIYLFMFPSIKQNKCGSILSRLSHFDYLGFVLIMAFWVTFTIGFLFAGGTWPWNDKRTIIVIVLSGVLLIAFSIQQYFCIFTTPESRSFPLHLLKSRTQVLLYITTATSMAGLYVPIYYIPIYFQFVRNDSSLEAAVRLLSFLILVIASSLTSGYLLPMVNYYVLFYVVSGLFLTIAGASYYAYISPSTQISTIYGLNVIGGIGVGITTQIGFSIATLKAHPRDAVHAITLQNFGQLGASVFALVIAGQVFQSTAIKNLTTVLGPAGYTTGQIQEVAAGAQSTIYQGLTDNLKELAIAAVTEAIRQDFILVIVTGAVILVASVAMKREKLFG